eukprot:c25711_g1_i1 orf=236-1768(-)
MFVVKVHSVGIPREERVFHDMATSSSNGRINLGLGEDGDGKDEGGSRDHGATKIVSFSSGNPRVETTRGVMHLYRNVSDSVGSLELLPVGRSEHLCVLAVPNYMTGADFCQFTGSFIQNIKEMRFVRDDAQSDRFNVLMKFDCQNLADEFYRHYNGKLFSSLEAEVCHVFFTLDVQYTKSGDQAASPPTGMTELPTCPVCLERLDQQVSGILTTLCNHTFHSSCISKWTDSSCPVCRYCQQQSQKSTCFICSTSENLWICVICGFVGCGRYQEGHAIRHWKETQHCYSLELETQRVWDYVGDGYVHRLIQSKTDGKLVELNAPCVEGSDECGSCECSHDSGMEEALFDSKMDAIANEYNKLLTSQLESQRQYFEGLLADSIRQRDAAISEAVEKAISFKLQKLQTKLDRVERDKKFLEQINESMNANQEGWKKKLQNVEERNKVSIKERDDRISDLEEQVRDLMVYIEAQKTVENSASAEIRDGTVLALPAGSTPMKSNRSPKIVGRKKH